MFELLPKNQKKELKREYFLRILTVILFLFFVIGILSLVSISPSYFLSLEKEKIVAKQFAEMEKLRNTNESDKESQSEIKKFKELNSFLKPPEKIVLIGDLVANIVNDKSQGIKIHNISVNSYKKEKYQVIIKGNASSRDILKLFVENLKEGGMFESVDLPISNFMKVTDIDFYITLITTI